MTFKMRNDLLWSTGGALQPKKCSYHVVSWEFNDGIPQLIPGQVGRDLFVTPASGTPIQIQPLSAYSSHKTLGHRKEPSGNQISQRKDLEKKCKKALILVSSSPLDRQTAWTYYFSHFLPSVGYPLSNCFFTQTQLKKLQSKVMLSIFAKCGFNRTTCQDILFGPSRFGGGNFRPFSMLQGVSQITTFLRHWRSPSQAGTLLKIAVSWTQLSAGTSVSFLEDADTPLSHLEVKWLPSLRSYLKHIHGYFELHETFVQPLQRLDDSYIMDHIINSQRFSPAQLHLLNCCRKYLQVTTISDITLPDGIQLEPNFELGNHSQTSPKCRLHWFYQERPPDDAWKLWQRANCLWSDEHGNLTTPLGAWLFPPSQQRMKKDLSPASFPNGLRASANCISLRL